MLNSLVYWSSNPVGYVWNASVFDNNVITSNFHDNDITSQGDQDHLFFDKQGVAFSYFSGHGETSQGSTQANIYWSEQLCTHNIQCMGGPGSYPLPANGSQYPGFCNRLPGDTFGACTYTFKNREIKMNNNWSGPNAAVRNARAPYGAGRVRWGESQFSGGWDWSGHERRHKLRWFGN